MTTTITPARNHAYEDDDSEVLISKATWPLKLTGLLFAGMLVIGRSASYGNITWTPAYHSAISPLVVVHQSDGSAPAPAVPKSVPLTDPGALSKRTAADEIVSFAPGSNSGDDEGKDKEKDRGGREKEKEKEKDKDKDKDKKKDPGHAALATGAANASANSPNETGATTQADTQMETVATTQAETQMETAQVAATATAAQGPNGNNSQGQNGINSQGQNGNNSQGSGGNNPTVLGAAHQAAWFARTEETPWLALGALAALGALIGVAFLKPWRFLHRFLR